MKSSMRINKFLAHAGVTSRRKVEAYLQQHEVTVNGERITDPALGVDPEKDMVEINGKQVLLSSYIYFILNKPKGVLSSASDDRGRTTVVELIETTERIYPVGRLDLETTGLLLLTNEGELAQRLTHPRYHIPKTYIAVIKGTVSEKKLERIRNGILLEDGFTAPAKVRINSSTRSTTTLKLTLYEGRKRQVRRMCEELSLPLTSLHRSTFGSLTLENLKVGESRPLRRDEVQVLRKHAFDSSS